MRGSVLRVGLACAVQDFKVESCEEFDPKNVVSLYNLDQRLHKAVKILMDEGNGNGKQWHVIAFWSFKFEPAECNYGTPDQEMLAIVKAFTHWRHYL
ncbi:hypothetical protein VTO42DRAFT_3943 [Malbranchea cinnamomea]